MNLASKLYSQLADPDDGVEQRRSIPRREAQLPIDLEVDGRVVRFSAQTRDVGRRSLGIVSKVPLVERSRVRVRLATEEGKEWGEFIVIHCTTGVGGYVIGLQCVDS